MNDKTNETSAKSEAEQILIEEKRQARELLRILQPLETLEGWKWIERVAVNQIAVRTNQIVYSPLADMDAALAQEFAKGEIAGIRVFVGLLRSSIEQAEDILGKQGMEEETEE